jgi:hypothetical protein
MVILVVVGKVTMTKIWVVGDVGRRRLRTAVAVALLRATTQWHHWALGLGWKCQHLWMTLSLL